MSFCRSFVVPFTTDGSGDASVVTGSRVNGRVLLVVYEYDDALTGADFTITGAETGTAVVTITNAGTSDAQWAPRQATHSAAGAASSYDGSNAVLDYVWLADEAISVVVADGGVSKSGTLTFIVG